MRATCEAANPRSDEEGEDLVAQVERSALRLFGESTLCARNWTPGGYGGDWIPIEQAPPEVRSLAHAWVKRLRPSD